MAARIDDLTRREQAALARWAEMRAISESFIDAAGRRHWQRCPELARWICLCVFTGREKIVAEALEQRDIESVSPQLPTEFVYRRGRKIEKPGRAMMPGYLLVRCIPGPAAIGGLIGLEHVFGVLGGAETPFALKAENISQIIASSAVSEKPSYPFKAGQWVRINDFVFEGYEGSIDRINSAKGEARIELSVMGRISKVWMPLAFLEKV